MSTGAKVAIVVGCVVAAVGGVVAWRVKVFQKSYRIRDGAPGGRPGTFLEALTYAARDPGVLLPSSSTGIDGVEGAA